MTAWSVRDQSGSRLPLASRDRVRATAIGPVDPRSRETRGPWSFAPCLGGIQVQCRGLGHPDSFRPAGRRETVEPGFGEAEDLCGLHPFPRYKIAVRIRGNDRQGSI